MRLGINIFEYYNNILIILNGSQFIIMHLIVFNLINAFRFQITARDTNKQSFFIISVNQCHSFHETRSRFCGGYTVI